MRYVIDIPDDITQVLQQHASAAGREVIDVIQTAVVSFARGDIDAASIGRLPDGSLPPLESAPQCDLPRSNPRAIPIQQTSRRLPDPIADMT